MAPATHLPHHSPSSRSHLFRRDDTSGNIANWYYAIIIIVVVIFIIVLYLGRKQVQRRRRALLSRRHSALAQDATGWPSSRRWVHGTWRRDSGTEARNSHGLDAMGEAPPPYNPSDSSPRIIAIGEERAPLVPRPEPAMIRGGSAVKPPEYEEVVQMAVRPAASESQSETTRATSSEQPAEAQAAQQTLPPQYEPSSAPPTASADETNAPATQPAVSETATTNTLTTHRPDA